jgi:hypothetical protein
MSSLHVREGVNALSLVPASRQRPTDVRLILTVDAYCFDLQIRVGTGEILGGHLCRFHGAVLPSVGVEAAHIHRTPILTQIGSAYPGAEQRSQNETDLSLRMPPV